MTQSITYSILFKGEAAEGENLDLVKSHFAKLFKADDTKIAQLFSGKVVALKKQISRDDAAKFQQLFKKTGAKIYLKEDATSIPAKQSTITPAPSAPIKTNSQATQSTQINARDVANTPASNSAITQAATQNNTTVNDEPYQKPHFQSVNIDDVNFDLSPTGADLLLSDEKTQFVEANIDTSTMDLAAAGSLLDVLKKETPPPAPDVDHISTADVGVTLGTPSPITENINPDISNISIADTGADLQDFIDDIPDFPPNTSHLSIAEAGEIIEILKEEKELLNPNTSYIHLDENS